MKPEGDIDVFALDGKMDAVEAGLAKLRRWNFRLAHDSHWRPALLKAVFSKI